MLLGAFMLMMACTPFSLKSGKGGISRNEEGVISRNEEGGTRKENSPVAELAAQISSLDSTLQGNLLPPSSFLLPRDSTLTPRNDSLVPRNVKGITVDSLARSLSPSTTLKEAAAKLKRDTTTMDSLELAIYKHNKAIDDSLALDSINRSRKRGIDSPVEYSANDSLTYDAGIYQARLFGESKVKYQNMDLASEKIAIRLDSNVVHAEGRLDTLTHETIGSPVFKMGSDE